LGLSCNVNSVSRETLSQRSQTVSRETLFKMVSTKSTALSKAVCAVV
jgi:hypothetical protein